MNGAEPDKPTRPAVPGRPDRIEVIDTEPEFEGLVNPRDLGSASRSCLAIFIVLAVIGLLVCVFLVGTVYK